MRRGTKTAGSTATAAPASDTPGTVPAASTVSARTAASTRWAASAPRVIVLIPVLNPGPALPRLVDELLASPAPATGAAVAGGDIGADEDLIGGIVVIDDGSGPGPDGSHDRLFDALASRGVLVHRLARNRGKGAALREGMGLIVQRFPGAGIVTADADGQHLLADIRALAREVAARTSGAERPRRRIGDGTGSGRASGTDPVGGRPELVLGARAFGADMPLRSRIGNRASTLLAALLTGRWIPDTQSGLRGIPPASIPWMLDQPGDRYEYEMRTLMAMAADRGSPRIRTVPVTAVYEEGNPTSSFRPVRDSLRVLRPVGAFLASGILSAGLDLGLFALLVTAGLPVAGAVVLARGCSAVVNFVLNRRVVFHDTAPWWHAAARYLLLALAVVAGSATITQLLVSTGAPVLPAKILADLGMAAVSFSLQRACTVPRGRAG